MVEYIYKRVNSIVFGLSSSDDIKKMSSVKVITPELYDKEGYPVDGGLMDIRLGVIDPGLRCKTCGGKLKECTGHFGLIELARPIIHIKYIKPILDFLRCTCGECGRILADEKTISSYNEAMKTKNTKKSSSELIKKLRNIKKCSYCNSKQFTIKIEKPTTFLEKDKRINPITIRSRLEKIPDSDVELLGLNPHFARPEWMVLVNLPIPPVTMRPSITLETGERSEDDLTHKLGDIVRINQRLFENLHAGAPEIIVEDLWDLLQYHITTYFDNTITQVPPARHRSGQPLKTITERIKSKEGRFRHNLVGKRVNFAARTVISPDPSIGFNDVGIPKEVAMDLTVPERVNDWNIKWLRKFVENGPTKYPGANYVVRPDGKKKKIISDTKEQLLEDLENGFIVERHLIDGDICIFNRQPSLHRMSIMGHKVKVLSGKSFRLNPAVCNPYNADFDGDEMNLHVPQNEESRTEAEILMQVQTQIISPKHGSNVIGCVEDAVSGNYLLTKNMEFTKEEAVALLLSIGVNNYSKFKNFKNKVSGKDVFSALLPEDFNFIGASRSKNEPVVIEDGNLVSGIIDDNLIGGDSGSLIRGLHKNYGEEITVNIVLRIFKLGIHVLLNRGFTTSLSDTDLSEQYFSNIKRMIEESEKNVDKLIASYHKNELEILPGKSVEETLELNILKVLNNVRNKIGDFLSGIESEDNSTMIMANSGAKGNRLNLVQMSACVGQQALRGKRIGKGYFGRTLSLFKRGNLSPIARGFIDRGYKSGLRPAEFFFHAMTGRDALMDTALRTPKSGYLYRRLANALQDLKVEYDYTVRDANKTIVQFYYGDDNIDVSKSEAGIINVKRIVKDIAVMKKWKS